MLYSVNAVLCGVIFITLVNIICAKCGGKTAIYDLLNGTITLHDDTLYPTNTYCEWLIQAPQHGQKILLKFREFNTECAFDYLKVYDGSSKNKLLGSFSGSTKPPNLFSNTSAIVLEFVSDNFYVKYGCVIDFLITECPGNCSGHGSCIDSQCYCDELFTGAACDIEICPDDCNNATGNGQCSQSNGCQCHPDFIGQSCSFSLHDNLTTGHWHLIKGYSPIFRSRFAHAGVFVQSTLWIFGGSNLNEVLGDLIKFTFDSNKWQLIATTGDRPAARFRHTMVSYKDTLVVFGGELANGTLLNDLWIFNISTMTWRRLYGSDHPPGLASHCATVHGDELILFGGQSQDYGFSYQMYTYDLVVQNGWKRITYKLAKLSHLRLIGHSCVFYPTLKSLIVFGGYRVVTGRQVKKVNTLLVYNVNAKVWFPVSASAGPKPTAYHSSVLMGDHMILYGGIVHTPYQDETCYGNDIYLLNLKNFTWTSITSDSHNGLNIRGRYSHVATTFNRNTLMVVGGFSGISSSNFVAYKIPSNIIHSDPNSTPMCHLFSQCLPCLTWGSQNDFQCGWCVQDSTCYQRDSPSGACSTNPTTRGWWGNEGSFLTSVDQCRIQDNSPGLLSNISYIISGSRLDRMRITNPLRFSGRSNTDVTVTWSGFIYPFLSRSIDDPISLFLRAGFSKSVSLHLSIDELQANKEKVISFNVKSQNWIQLSNAAKRPDDSPLFPNGAMNKMYYMEVRAQFQAGHFFLEVSDGDGNVIDGKFVRPFYSQDCSKHSTCFKCLSDMSCGWCPSSNSCVRRNSSVKCQHSSGEDIYLVLNITYCDSCAFYIDCESCSKVDQCLWNEDQCDQIVGTNKAEPHCASSCESHKSCGSCVKNRNCLWCESKNKCVPVTSLPGSFIYGQCAHYSDNNTKIGQCPLCSQQNGCGDCWKTAHCGWCGEYHNGSCFAGGYDSPDSGNCNQLMSSNTTTNIHASYDWSYAACPDENECITRRDCDVNADCFDVVGSYRCECRQGYEGDGKFCKALCAPPCVHGECIKHASNASLDECDCDLGWTGPVCSVDCQCNNHSTCQTAIGVCDDCQDLTRGANCELCVSGSYGNAASATGCKKCECHGHGDEERGICDDTTGHCFCMNSTMGPHCDQCLPGLSGHPERGESCYYPCKHQSILANTTEGILSSLLEPGQGYDPKNVKCVWIITTLTHHNHQVVYSNKLASGTITFDMKDISLDCQTDHIYVYDGMPNYELGGVKSSSNLIGSLCGSDASSIPVIESRSGSLVVVFKGNVGLHSLTEGFNASFVVNQCPDSCTGNRYCHSNGTHESCVCKPGWIGAACDDVVCPANCSEGLGRGHCDQISRKCVCKSGFSGRSCNIQHPSDDFIWRYSSHVSGSSQTLARMGHSLTADDQTQSLIIYGGYSLYFGILGDIWKYDTNTEKYAQENSWNRIPRPRYFHAADVYKRTMYVTGGITSKGYSSEVWKYNLDTKQWQMGQVLPRELAGHTVNVIDDILYLIGGYSYEKQCSSNVYTLNLETMSSNWVDLNPTGDIFDACFGHSTVYDRSTNSLVVFGKRANKMKPTLAVLKLTTNKWVVVPDVPEVYLRYFHVSIIVGNVMVVTTGYTGDDAQDFADKALVYDLRCGSWHTPHLKGLVPSSMAHSAIVSMNNVTYMFGGYNGQSSRSLYRQNISSNWCALFSTEISCSQITNCTWCRDDARNLTGCFVSNSDSHLNCNTANTNCPPTSFAMSMASPLTSGGDACIEKTVPGGCSICIQGSTCSWFVGSHLCVSHSFQAITCAFGLCGRVLRHHDVCPASCNASTYCYDCLKQYNCGWCTSVSQNGSGVCTEGTLQGPYNGTCPGKNDATTWVSTVCLPENECSNGHHHCKENETCVDLELSYKCECLPGFDRINGSCTPVCSQGCLHGSCINPDQCFCNFGWVGINCSTACECHGKGRCINETHLDYCRDCRDHTTGPSCDRCLPGYVGQNGDCMSCFEKCSKNAEKCYEANEKNTTEEKLFGPRDDDNIHCECSDTSEGDLCKYCKLGFFRYGDGCKKCKCRGHSATCNRNSGKECDCHNRTRTPANAENTNQCSQCENEYLGSPDVEGQQCYHKLTVLGHRSFARELENAKYLLPYQTSFFYILPSYTNINVRLIIDIFFGSLEVYISDGDNAFKVDPNQNVTISLPKISSPDSSTDGLNTYTKFSVETEVIVFKQMKHRLVVTFPSNEHGLDNAKFYIIIKAGNDGANGIIYFKQDSTKINLIVFFIVFASCFVFLLSGLSIVWSIKTHFHSRQEVHNLEVENERRHNRPFATFAFLFEYQPPAPSVIRHRKTTASTRKAIQPMGVECTSDYHATITTVLFQMPQTDKTKMTVSLGTTLALATPQQKDKLVQPCEPKQTTNL